MDPSVGSVGDANDNALAESQIHLHKAELIRPEGPWRGVEHVGLETLNWVDFINTERPHAALHDLTPMAAEELHYDSRIELQPTGRTTKLGLRTSRGASVVVDGVVQERVAVPRGPESPRLYPHPVPIAVGNTPEFLDVDVARSPAVAFW